MRTFALTATALFCLTAVYAAHENGPSEDTRIPEFQAYADQASSADELVSEEHDSAMIRAQSQEFPKEMKASATKKASLEQIKDSFGGCQMNALSRYHRTGNYGKYRTDLHNCAHPSSPPAPPPKKSAYQKCLDRQTRWRGYNCAHRWLCRRACRLRNPEDEESLMSQEWKLRLGRRQATRHVTTSPNRFWKRREQGRRQKKHRRSFGGHHFWAHVAMLRRAKALKRRRFAMLRRAKALKRRRFKRERRAKAHKMRRSKVVRTALAQEQEVAFEPPEAVSVKKIVKVHPVANGHSSPFAPLMKLTFEDGTTSTEHVINLYGGAHSSKFIVKYAPSLMLKYADGSHAILAPAHLGLWGCLGLCRLASAVTHTAGALAGGALHVASAAVSKTLGASLNIVGGAIRCGNRAMAVVKNAAKTGINMAHAMAGRALKVVKVAAKVGLARINGIVKRLKKVVDMVVNVVLGSLSWLCRKVVRTSVKFAVPALKRFSSASGSFANRLAKLNPCPSVCPQASAEAALAGAGGPTAIVGAYVAIALQVGCRIGCPKAWRYVSQKSGLAKLQRLARQGGEMRKKMGKNPAEWVASTVCGYIGLRL